jgi:spore maturation protein CgeB
MKSGIRIAFFGSSLVSAYWNGAATYYRGILHALARRGHQITFYEPDAFERQKHRDIEDPDWARVVVYSAMDAAVINKLVRRASRDSDLVIKASGVGVHDALLEAAVLEYRRANRLVAFWDVDAPATLDRVHDDPADAFRALIPQYDVIFTYGGGDPVVTAYNELGARVCVPVYNALDPDTHFPVVPEARFEGDLAFLGNRLPDREHRVDEFFFHAAELLPRHTFLLGGNGWADRAMPPNVRYVGHVYTKDHNAFNCSPKIVLNVNRASMARYGFSPPTRVFEAAGARACLITDAWVGIEMFLDPGSEVLIARNGAEVAELMQTISTADALRIGAAAHRRIIGEHTYAHRAAQVDAVLASLPIPILSGSAR